MFLDLYWLSVMSLSCSVAAWVVMSVVSSRMLVSIFFIVVLFFLVLLLFLPLFLFCGCCFLFCLVRRGFVVQSYDKKVEYGSVWCLFWFWVFFCFFVGWCLVWMVCCLVQMVVCVDPEEMLFDPDGGVC